MRTTRSPAPIIAAVLLLMLPLLYVGSYLALRNQRTLADPYYQPCRFGGSYSEKIFWPLEQIDRRLRPATWELLITETLTSHDRCFDP
jgi:hypothetical protein